MSKVYWESHIVGILSRSFSHTPCFVRRWVRLLEPINSKSSSLERKYRPRNFWATLKSLMKMTCSPMWRRITSKVQVLWNSFRYFRQFERIAEHCDSKLSYIPLTFMLGFFVTIVVDRWKNIFQNMGWIEKYATSSFKKLYFWGSSQRCRPADAVSPLEEWTTLTHVASSCVIWSELINCLELSGFRLEPDPVGAVAELLLS